MLLAGAILVIAFLLLVAHKVVGVLAPEGTVRVYQGREGTVSYPLDEDRTEVFLSPQGGRNILVIKEGEVYMEDADCPDRLCVKQGRISGVGQTLTCLPHGLQIRIEGSAGTGPDAVTG